MKSLILTLITCLTLFSCQFSNTNEKPMGRANRVNGILVFIQSQPVNEYEVIEPLRHDAVLETLQQTKGKKFGEAVGAFVSKSIENMNLKEQIYKMTELAKKQNPKTEGIIISDKIFEAELIVFK